MTLFDQKPSLQKVRLPPPRRKPLLGRERHTLRYPCLNGFPFTPELMEPGGEGQGVSYAGWVRQLTC